MNGPARQTMTVTHWLICIIAAIGFAFDIYELLMMPLIARPALSQLLGVNPYTASGNAQILSWTTTITVSSAVCGGFFGLLGGYLTDRLGRRRVLVGSILLYAGSAFAAGFATSAPMLLALRCAVFVGVCVEFVAAVAWLAELFPEPKQREQVLGYTQAFSSVGGMLVTAAYLICVRYADQFPAIHGEHVPWRYCLISGLIPALPLLVIRPFLPESPEWERKAKEGTLRRPSFAELFQPALLRTTLVTAAMFMASFGAAFGAIQLAPQIVPGLVPEVPKIVALRKQYEAAKEKNASVEIEKLQGEIDVLDKRREEAVSQAQLFQEFGGLLGRFALAFLAVRIASRRTLLRLFQIPGLIIIPLVFLFPAQNNLSLFKWGLFAAGFLTVAQFSFWGNYLPRVYPLHLRGTGESFAANVGGRMFGTSVMFITTSLALYMPSDKPFGKTALACAAVAAGTYLLGTILCFFLPEPKEELAD